MLEKKKEVKRGLLLTYLFGVFLFHRIQLPQTLLFLKSAWVSGLAYIPNRSRLHPVVHIHLFIKEVLLPSAMAGDLKDSKAIFPIRTNVLEARCMQALSKAHSLNA